jgi:hypothetical protein
MDRICALFAVAIVCVLLPVTASAQRHIGSDWTVYENRPEPPLCQPYVYYGPFGGTVRAYSQTLEPGCNQLMCVRRGFCAYAFFPELHFPFFLVRRWFKTMPVGCVEVACIGKPRISR